MTHHCNSLLRPAASIILLAATLPALAQTRQQQATQAFREDDHAQVIDLLPPLEQAGRLAKPAAFIRST